MTCLSHKYNINCMKPQKCQKSGNSWNFNLHEHPFSMISERFHNSEGCFLGGKYSLILCAVSAGQMGYHSHSMLQRKHNLSCKISQWKHTWTDFENRVCKILWSSWCIKKFSAMSTFSFKHSFTQDCSITVQGQWANKNRQIGRLADRLAGKQTNKAYRQTDKCNTYVEIIAILCSMDLWA